MANTSLFEVVILVFYVILMRYVIPTVKNRMSEEQRAQALQWVHVAVYAAEKLYGSGKGAEKLEYAKNLLEQRGFTFDPDELTALINAEIKRMENEESVIVVGDIDMETE